MADSVDQSRRRTMRNLAIFTFAVITLGWLGRWLDSLGGTSSSEEGFGKLIWIVSPLVVSFLLRAFAGDGWRDLGILPALRRNVVWYAVSLLVYPVCITIILAIGLASGAVSFPDSPQDGVGLIGQTLVVALATGFIKNIFEEFAWRGYLAPKMYTLGWNDFAAHTLVGLIWGAWHLPYLLFVTSYLTESSAALIPCFLLGTISVSIVYGEIRILTDSVWPAVLMHTVGGALIGTLYLSKLFEFKDGTESLVSPGVEGVLSIVLFAFIGVGIHLLRMNRRTYARHEAETDSSLESTQSPERRT